MEVEEIAKQALTLKAKDLWPKHNAFMELYRVISMSVDQKIGDIPMINLEIPANYFCALVEKSINNGDVEAIRRHNDFEQSRSCFSCEIIADDVTIPQEQEEYMTFDDLTNQDLKNAKEDT